MSMFCFQCEQTVGCRGCTGRAGVCGKQADTSNLQDALTGALVGLARAVEENSRPHRQSAPCSRGLFITITNVTSLQRFSKGISGRSTRKRRYITGTC